MLRVFDNLDSGCKIIKRRLFRFVHIIYVLYFSECIGTTSTQTVTGRVHGRVGAGIISTNA